MVLRQASGGLKPKADLLVARIRARSQTNRWPPMSDNKHVQKNSSEKQKYFIPGFIAALAGLMLHPIFFIGTLICLTLAMPTRNQRNLMAALSALFILVSFGYGLGKDLALRDNRADAGNQLKTP